MSMNWTDILAKAGIADSPGYQETIADCRLHPYVKPKKKAKQSKAKKK